MDIKEAKEIIQKDWLFTTNHELDNNNNALKQAIETVVQELEQKDSYIEQLKAVHNEAEIEVKQLKVEKQALLEKLNKITCRDTLDYGQYEQGYYDCANEIEEFIEGGINDA
ncbi:MAG: hypothetical protein LBL91_06195 [Lachnospiraceae bacterium]|nr:hypothetical protein [Lachnospiraceae bacterium]